MVQDLSQDEINNIISSVDSNKINKYISDFASTLSLSLEEVLKIAFNLDVVVKLISISDKHKEDIALNGKTLRIDTILKLNEREINIFIFLSTEFAVILSDLMLMGPGESKDDLSDEDMDAIREMTNQVLANFRNAIKVKFQGISFDVKSVMKDANCDDVERVYYSTFEIAIPGVKTSDLVILVNKEEFDALFKDDRIKKEIHETENVKELKTFEPKLETFSDKEKEHEIRNLDLIMDINLKVEVRIGEKEMLIKDILNLNDGSIVEIDKNIEEPMDIIVNGKSIAKGVVVVVGGHFGIRITDIESKKDRVRSLGNIKD